MSFKKIERPKKTAIVDRIEPKNIPNVVKKFNTEIEKVYDYLDKLVDYINSKE